MCRSRKENAKKLIHLPLCKNVKALNPNPWNLWSTEADCVTCWLEAQTLNQGFWLVFHCSLLPYQSCPPSVQHTPAEFAIFPSVIIRFVSRHFATEESPCEDRRGKKEIQQAWFGVTNLLPFNLPSPVLLLLSPSCTGRHVGRIKMCRAFCPADSE